MYGILIGVNLRAPLLGLEFESDGHRQWYEAPGFAIVLACFVLFAMLGIVPVRIDEGGLVDLVSLGHQRPRRR